MMARLPPRSTNRQTASTFGPIEPLAKWPSAAYDRISSTVTVPMSAASGRAVVQHRVRYVGRDHEHVDLDGLREQCGAQVLVDDRLDAAQ